ncbi:hypothetical protein WCLP8_2300002 [uncultured Gammaproteobacteria bacterium]
MKWLRRIMLPIFLMMDARSSPIFIAGTTGVEVGRMGFIKIEWVQESRIPWTHLNERQN